MCGMCEDVEGEIRVWSLEALVVDEVSLGRVSDEGPLVARNVSVDIDGSICGEADVQLETVVSPRSELHVATLDVERKIGDVDATG